MNLSPGVHRLHHVCDSSEDLREVIDEHGLRELPGR
jgi:hypothetical protein